MHRTLKALIACCAAYLATCWLPGSGAVHGADAEIVFDPPLVVVVRQSNGLPARGELLRMNAESLWLRALNGKEVRLKLANVRSVRTSNESFEYWPGEESFAELAQRVGSIAGASLNGTVASSPRGNARRGAGGSPKLTDPGQMDPDARKEARRAARLRQSEAASGDVRGNQRPVIPGFKGREEGSDDPENVPSSEPVADRAGAGNVADTGGDGGAVPGTEVLLCSQCEKELPAGFTGGACPHCGKVLAFEDTGPSNPFAVKPGAPGGPANPFATKSAPTTPPTAAMPAVQPASTTPAPAPAQPIGLANMPVIAKVGIFAGFLIVGWFLLQRR